MSCLKELRLGRDDLSRKQSLLINRTLNYATRSRCRMQHGAMVVKSGRIISMSNNKMVNHPDVFCQDMFEQHRAYVSMHAEVAALQGVSPEVARGSTVYVARMLRDGTPGMSRPCPRCEAYLNEMGVKKVIYT